MKKLLWIAPLLLLSLNAFAAETPKPPKPNPVYLKIVTAQQGEVAELYQTSITLEAKKRVILTAQTAGPIAKKYVSSGDQVKAGAPLLKISSSALDGQIQGAQANLSSAQAQLSAAKANLARQKKLLDAGFITNAAYEASETALKAANSSLNAARGSLISAKAGLDAYLIKAPFDGTVLHDFDLYEGSQISPGMTLIDLGTPDQLKVKFAFPEKYQRVLKKGTEGLVYIDDIKDPFTVVIISTDPFIDTNTRLINAIATPKNCPALPGSVGKIVLKVQTEKGTVVPSSAILELNQQTYVNKVVNGEIQRQEVETGLNQNGYVIIRKGLNNDEKIVAIAQPLDDGTPVNELK